MSQRKNIERFDGVCGGAGPHALDGGKRNDHLCTGFYGDVALAGWPIPHCRRRRCRWYRGRPLVSHHHSCRHRPRCPAAARLFDWFAQHGYFPGCFPQPVYFRASSTIARNSRHVRNLRGHLAHLWHRCGISSAFSPARRPSGNLDYRSRIYTSRWTEDNPARGGRNVVGNAPKRGAIRRYPGHCAIRGL